jgi:hypothetical protein
MARDLGLIASVGAILLLGCGGSGALPAPPSHTPADSPEPATACPTERAAGKEAREAVLEDESPAHREAVAAAVFAQAECERRQLDAARLEGATQTALIEAIRAARLQYQNARNLYGEVGNYEVLRWTIGARSRGGDLELGFGDMLRAVRPPSELTEPSERAGFLAELGDLAQIFDANAVALHSAALETAALVPTLSDDDAQVARWIAASCRAFSRFGVPRGRDAGMCK